VQWANLSYYLHYNVPPWMHPEGFIRRRRRVVAPSSSEIDLAGLVVPQYNRARENTHTHDMSAKEFRELVRKAQVERRERLQSKFEAILCQAQKEAEKGKCHIYFEEKCWDPILVEMIKQRGFHVSVYAQ
jgi:hypothetical protein